ncbi:MAG: hypothetical protein Q4A55_07680 [Aerococcus sp.]|nr:hypothetical protein [Aerococcus sp.]
MRTLLDRELKYFTQDEAEVQDLLSDLRAHTQGKIVKEQVDLKTYNAYGNYYEVTVKERYTTSKLALEMGKINDGDFADEYAERND